MGSIPLWLFMLGLGTLLIVACAGENAASTPIAPRELTATVVSAATTVPEATPAPTPQLATTTAATPTVTSTLQPEATETPTSVHTATTTPGPTADNSPTPTTQLASTIAATPTVTAPLQPTATETPTIAPMPGTPTTPSSSASSNPPTDLALPFRIEDVGGGNEFISPFGIIRHSRDTGIGHGASIFHSTRMLRSMLWPTAPSCRLKCPVTAPEGPMLNSLYQDLTAKVGASEVAPEI